LSNTAAWIGPSSNWTDRAAAVERDGVAPIASAVVARWLTAEYALAHREHVAALEAMLSATPQAGYATNCLAVRDNDLRGDIARIRAPTLVISGSADLPTPPSDGQFLAAQIPGARFVQLCAAHLSNQELPEEFSALLCEFLHN
jgi:3-oxoadipate enol-lactonase